MKKVACFASGILVLSLLFLSFKTSVQKEYTLVYKPEVGSKFTILSSSDFEQSVDMMGQEMVTTSITETENIFETKSIDDEGNINFEVEFKVYNQSVKNPQFGDRDIDFSELIGKKVNITITKKGNPILYEGFEDLPAIAGAMQGASAESFKRGFDNVFPKLPEEAKKIGDSWTKKEEDVVPQGAFDLNTITNTEYTIAEEVKKDGFDCLKIDYKVTVSISGTGEQQGQQMALEMDGEGEGTLFFAYKKGMFLSRESSNLMEGTIMVSGQQNMTLPVVNDIKSSTTVKF